ncbi:MAG: inorganic phosphate transporter [Flavobacteriaceae bacterium TMED120]|nr:MAG: inorganic phosphate transporter [Flavobacteriaceae bacterium TMED120]HCQ24017.1 phosphate:sodium symporter [Flavobacteriaceae bacterium]|tara:strand:+ start:2006 stop:4282 length:2277 start_codon:yes stop_codon:yes gene_type:complete
MEGFYLEIIIVLSLLAIGDLIVGVSNDAVNFLNSALGSKVFNYKSIMIFASAGIALGALFSSGMMEVARKGIFNPEAFFFDEIIYIFLAVMITDILLLDFFNTLGMPTSTTVSIVFELLGAAVVLAVIKIYANNESLTDIDTYINTSKAVQIILGILLSVFIAFTIGALVQTVSRILLSYNFDSKPLYINAIFGAISAAAIVNFIVIKGLKGTDFANTSYDLLNGNTLNSFLENQYVLVTIAIAVLLFIILYTLMRLIQLDVYKFIIGLGTFSLALAFAGNDLVNFIGVPIAAYQSYLAWVSSGVEASLFNMSVLSAKVPTPTVFLFASGLIMIVTLWFSAKAKRVVQTSLDLSDQNQIKERFRPNYLSRQLVRFFSNGHALVVSITPSGINNYIKKSMATDRFYTLNNKNLPAFDKLRASINLVVASVLIAIATSLKLPLSTTYVTFMVAMGTSLADRAWGTDSAVYRVAGVVNVIVGWFFTALSAFVVCGLITSIIYFGGNWAILSILVLVVLIIGRNFLSKTDLDSKISSTFNLNDKNKSLENTIVESGENIMGIFEYTLEIYEQLIEGLAADKYRKLNEVRQKSKVLQNDLEELRGSSFYFIKTLESENIKPVHSYINLLGVLHDLTEDIQYLTKISYQHSYNNHRKISELQHEELLAVLSQLKSVYRVSQEAFARKDKMMGSKEFKSLMDQKEPSLNLIQEEIQKQIIRTREVETSVKNTAMYFNLLLRTKDLITHKFEIIEEYAVMTATGKD